MQPKSFLNWKLFFLSKYRPLKEILRIWYTYLGNFYAALAQLGRALPW